MRLGMRRHVAEIRLVLVEVLDQMVPQVPFPDDLARGFAGRLDFDDGIGLHVAATFAPGGRGL